MVETDTKANPFDAKTTIIPYVLGANEDNTLIVDGIRMPVSYSYKRLPVVELVVLDNFMSIEECNELIDYSQPLLGFSPTIHTASGTALENPVRESLGAGFPKASTDLLAAIEERAAKVIHLPSTHSPGFHVVMYGPGKNYDKPHQDFFRPNTEYGRSLLNTPEGNNICTFIVYLSDIAVGGGTRFPRLNITVTPKVGRALFFSFTKYSEELETAHLGLAPLVDEKWIAINWYRQGPFAE